MLAIIQARLSSARLPGKVLLPLAGRPLLAWLIGQLKHAKRLDEIVVATSSENDDDPIHTFCGDAGVRCYRGPLADVSERLAAAAEWAGADAFVRISGDSPLMMPSVVDDVVSLYEMDEVDLATNVQTRTFPKGLSVEVISVSALRRAQTMMQAEDAEHVTPVFYRHPLAFRIANLTSGHDWGRIQMSVDRAEDFVVAERMLASAGGSLSELSLSELVALHERCVTSQRA